MLLADSGFYFHLSQLANSPEKFQYIQVIQVPIIHQLFSGAYRAVYRQALPKQLGLPNSVSYYAGINEFVSVLYNIHCHHPSGTSIAVFTPTLKISDRILLGLEGFTMIHQRGMHSPQPVSSDFWQRRRHSENAIVLFLLDQDHLTDFLLDEREISEFLYLTNTWIPFNIERAKPGDPDLLTEIQRIESLQEPGCYELVTDLEQVVVDWLQVSSKFFIGSQAKDHSLMAGKFVHHSCGRTRRKMFYHDG